LSRLSVGTKYLSYLGFPTSRDVLKSLALTTSLCAIHIGVQHGVPLRYVPTAVCHLIAWCLTMTTSALIGMHVLLRHVRLTLVTSLYAIC